MRTIPAISWYLELTEGSKETARLNLSNKWRLANLEGTGSPPVEYQSQPFFEIDGEIVSSYSIQPRPLIVGIFYKGAKKQREYYAARRRLLRFVRPNQFSPVRLYVTLPSHDLVYIEVFPSPGAALPLSQDRGRTFLEPVNFTAYDPFWRSVEETTGTITLASIAQINAPNKATIAISSDTGAVTSDSVKVDVGVVSGGSGGAVAGFVVEHKKTSEADSAYSEVDLGSETTHTFNDLDDQTDYSFRATAYNSAGDGAVSDVLTQTTPQYIPPLAAPEVTHSVTTTTISLSWAAITNASKYQVRSKLHTDANYGSWDDVSSTSYTLSGLQEQTSYDIQVRSVFIADDNTESPGEATTLEEIATTAQLPPGPVRNLSLSSSGVATWNAPNTGGAATSYSATYGRYQGGSRSGGSTANTTITVDFDRLSGPSGQDTYWIRITPHGPGGSGPSSTTTVVS